MNINEDFDFKAYNQKLNEPGKWVFIVPVSGIELTSSVNNEFRVNRVLFVSQKKLPRIRSRLGIPSKISEMRDIHRKFFRSSECFAVIRQSGTPDEAKGRARQQIRDALSILSISQLGYQKRRFGSCPSIQGEPHFGKINDLLLNTEDQRFIQQDRLIGKHRVIVLDDVWRNFHKKVFFFRLLEVLDKKKNVSDSWRRDLERAAILMGQSQCSSDIAHSFLWNMISLELLLTVQGDKYTSMLPKRIEALLGWVGYWDVENYKEKIEGVYKKRSAFVHDGDRSSILVQDLLFTDDLLLNLMTNLMHHVDLFTSKQDVIDFVNKVEAEHVLGLKPRVRPKTLRFLLRKYSKEDLQEV